MWKGTRLTAHTSLFKYIFYRRACVISLWALRLQLLLWDLIVHTLFPSHHAHHCLLEKKNYFLLFSGCNLKGGDWSWGNSRSEIERRHSKVLTARPCVHWVCQGCKKITSGPLVHIFCSRKKKAKKKLNETFDAIIISLLPFTELLMHWQTRKSIRGRCNGFWICL